MNGSGSSGDTRVRAAVADFLSSRHAADLAPAERPAAGEVARAFLDACYGDLGARPDLLDGEHLREALLRILPRRLDPREPMSRRAPQVVRALLGHLFEQRANQNAWNLDAVLDEADDGFVAALEAHGGSEVAATAPEPLKRPGSKLGRNDPCPCGSGRKYKKCCAKEE